MIISENVIILFIKLSKADNCQHSEMYYSSMDWSMKSKTFCNSVLGIK